jgi:hypothetical protein
MTQLTFRDCAVPLSILFLCMALNVALRENFVTVNGESQYISGSSSGWEEVTRKGLMGNLDRSEDAKKYEKKSLSALKSIGIFDKSDENPSNNVDLTNWASFDPLVGLNSKTSSDVVGSFAQVTNHAA